MRELVSKNKAFDSSDTHTHTQRGHRETETETDEEKEEYVHMSRFLTIVKALCRGEPPRYDRGI